MCVCRSPNSFIYTVVYFTMSMMMAMAIVMVLHTTKPMAKPTASTTNYMAHLVTSFITRLYIQFVKHQNSRQSWHYIPMQLLVFLEQYQLSVGNSLANERKILLLSFPTPLPFNQQQRESQNFPKLCSIIVYKNHTAILGERHEVGA